MSAHWFVRTLVTSFLVVSALSAVRPMVAYRALEIGATPTQVGVIAASYAMFAIFLAVPIGRWVDRLGEPRFIVAGTLVIACTSATLTLIGSVPGLILSHAILGIGQILTVVGLQSLLTSGSSAAGFDGRFGMFAVAASLGQIVGPAAGGFVGGLAGAGLDGVFAGASAIGFVAMLVGVSLWRWPPPGHRTQSDRKAETSVKGSAMRRLLGRPGMPRGLFASLTVLASIDILFAYLPVYGEHYRIPVATVGLLLASRAAMSMTARLVMVPLIRLLGRRALLASSLAITATALAILPLAGDRTVWLYVLMSISGIGLGLGQPMTMSWVAASAPITERATALSVRITGNRLGQFLLPSAVGVLAGAAGVAAIFVGLGVMLATSAAAVATASMGSEYEAT